MSRDPQTITLGGKSWEIRPLTFDQVEALSALIAEENWGKISLARRAIAIAIARHDPEGAKALGDLEVTPREIWDALGAVMRLGGFVESPPGEGKAEAAG